MRERGTEGEWVLAATILASSMALLGVGCFYGEACCGGGEAAAGLGGSGALATVGVGAVTVALIEFQRGGAVV